MSNVSIEVFKLQTKFSSLLPVIIDYFLPKINSNTFTILLHIIRSEKQGCKVTYKTIKANTRITSDTTIAKCLDELFLMEVVVKEKSTLKPRFSLNVEFTIEVPESELLGYPRAIREALGLDKVEAIGTIIVPVILAPESHPKVDFPRNNNWNKVKALSVDLDADTSRTIKKIKLAF